MIKDPSFCKSCGLYCDLKYSVYSYARCIRAAIQLPDPFKLNAFVDTPEKYMPTKIPIADVCVASGLHKDLLLELPSHLQKAGIRGLIVPIEDFFEVPLGLRKQVEDRCKELGLENAFLKPFCSLEAAEGKPFISRFVTELNIGRPSLEILTARRDKHEIINSTVVRRSAPCGSTWYVAKKLVGVKLERGFLYDAVAKAHHSYPCTATMAIDPETKEPILHIGGFLIREAVEKALRET